MLNRLLLIQDEFDRNCEQQNELYALQHLMQRCADTEERLANATRLVDAVIAGEAA
jgi:hypothetical protein